MANTSSIFKGSRAKILAKDGIGLEAGQNLKYTDGAAEGAFLMSDASGETDLKSPRFAAGPLTDVTVTDKGSGLVDVSSITAMFNTAADFTGNFVERSVTGLTDLQLVANTYTYIMADYNGDSPILSATTNNNLINHATTLNVVQLYWENVGALNELHVFKTGKYGLGLPNKTSHRLIHTDRYGWESGLDLGEYGTRNISISAGKIWYDSEEISTLSVATATAGQEANFYYHVGGNWTAATSTTYNNSQYDNGTALVSLTANRYAVNWIYKCVNSSDRCSFIVLGNGDYKLAEAINSQPPSIPDVVLKQAVLVGRIIVLNGASTATQIDSAFDIAFAGGTPNHNDLGGLQGGTTDEYYHMTASEHANMQSIPQDTIEPTGFVDPDNIGVSYDKSAKTVTLTHSSGTIYYYIKGVKYSRASPYTSPAHDVANGYYWFTFNTSNVATWTYNAFPGFNDGVFCAYVNYGSTDKFCVRETHGLMEWQAWQNIHQTVGTYRLSGGSVVGGSYTLNTNSVAAVTPDTDQCVIRDEDFNTTIPAFTAAEGYTLVHINTGSAVFTTGSTVPYPQNGTNIQYNQNPISGTALTEMTVSNRFVNVYGIYIPAASDTDSQKYRILWMIGQQIYTTAAAAVTEDFRSLNTGNLSTLFAEFVPYIRLTFIRTNSNNTFNAQINVDPTYLTGSKLALVSVSGLTPTDHQVLTGRTTADSHPTTAISTTVTNFNGILSSADTTSQAALETIDDYMSVVTVSSNVTLTKNRIHLVDTSAARSLALPTPTLNTWITVKDKTGSAQTNNITITRAGSEKIETVAANYSITTDLQSLTFVSDGTDWFIC